PRAMRRGRWTESSARQHLPTSPAHSRPCSRSSTSSSVRACSEAATSAGSRRGTLRAARSEQPMTIPEAPPTADAVPAKDTHPQFGPLLTRRRRGVPEWIVYSILAVLIAVFTIAALLGGVSAPYSGPAAFTALERLYLFLGSSVGFGLLFLIYDHL